jgi:hypothetical protein
LNLIGCLTRVEPGHQILSADILQSALDFLVDLSGEWHWKRDSIPKNVREMSELDNGIEAMENNILTENQG